MTVNIAIAGSSGRMGRTLIEAVLRNSDTKLAAALEITGSPHLGKDAGEFAGAPCGVKITDDIERALKGCDALIDFTRPEGTLHHVALCRKLGVRPIIGTTGFDDAGKKAINAGEPLLTGIWWHLTWQMGASEDARWRKD